MYIGDDYNTWNYKDKNKTTLNYLTSLFNFMNIKFIKIVFIHNKSIVINIWTIKTFNSFQIYSYDKYICKLVFQTQYFKAFLVHYHIAIQASLFTIYYNNSTVYTISYILSCWLMYIKFSSFENRRVHVCAFKIYFFRKIGNLPFTFFQFQINIPILCYSISL